MSLPEGVSEETWSERVHRRFVALSATRPPDARFSAGQNRTLTREDAKYQADKEMLNEIHLMLRYLCSAAADRV